MNREPRMARFNLVTLHSTEIAAHGLVASMSRTGDCYDNAVAESFFASLKAEWVNCESYSTKTEAHLSIAEYIERFYNSSRRHSYLGYLSPIEFELKARVVALAA
jgi:putative transposase